MSNARAAHAIDLAFKLLSTNAQGALSYFQQVKNPNAQVYLGMMKCYMKLKDYSKAFNISQLVNKAELLGNEPRYLRERQAACYTHFAFQAKRQAKAFLASQDISKAMHELDEAQHFLKLSQTLKHDKGQNDPFWLELNKLRIESCQRLSQLAIVSYQNKKPTYALAYFKQAQHQAHTLSNPTLLAEATQWTLGYYRQQMKHHLFQGLYRNRQNTTTPFDSVLALQQEAVKLLGEEAQVSLAKLVRTAEKGIQRVNLRSQAAKESPIVVEEKKRDSTEQIFSSFSSLSESSMDFIIDIHDDEEKKYESEVKVDLSWKKPSVSRTASSLFTPPPLLVNLQNDNYRPDVGKHFAPLIVPYRR